MKYLSIGSCALLERVTIKQNWSEKEEKPKKLRLMCAADLIFGVFIQGMEFWQDMETEIEGAFLFTLSPSRYNSVNDWI